MFYSKINFIFVLTNKNNINQLNLTTMKTISINQLSVYLYNSIYVNGYDSLVGAVNQLGECVVKLYKFIEDERTYDVGDSKENMLETQYPISVFRNMFYLKVNTLFDNVLDAIENDYI